MPPQTAVYRQKLLTTIFGVDVLSADHVFVWNEDDCQFDYKQTIPTRTTLTVLGTGYKYTVAVNPAGTAVRECDDPPGSCTKVVTLLVDVWKQLVVAGTELNAEQIMSRRLKLRTQCLEQCCE